MKTPRTSQRQTPAPNLGWLAGHVPHRQPVHLPLVVHLEGATGVDAVDVKKQEMIVANRQGTGQFWASKAVLGLLVSCPFQHAQIVDVEKRWWSCCSSWQLLWPCSSVAHPHHPPKPPSGAVTARTPASGSAAKAASACRGRRRKHQRQRLKRTIVGRDSSSSPEETRMFPSTELIGKEKSPLLLRMEVGTTHSIST